MSEETFLILMYIPFVLLVVMLLIVANTQLKELRKFRCRANREAAQQAHQADVCQRCGAPGFAIYLCDNHYEDLIGH